MANSSLAGSAQETHASRIERGLRLFEERGVEIRYVVPAGLWWVPNPSGGFYASVSIPSAANAPVMSIEGDRVST